MVTPTATLADEYVSVRFPSDASADPRRASVDAGESGYDGTQARGRRRAPRSQLRHEDKTLTATARRQLVATTHDLQRNFAIARWAINKHLDYVSAFKFQASSGDDAVDERVEQFMTTYASKYNCDVAHRHRLGKMIRLAEALRCVQGDVGLLKRSTGHLQAIEGDRVRNTSNGAPEGLNLADFTHGVRTDENGRAMAYLVCNRGSTLASYEYQSIVPARLMFWHGAYDRFDQVRGVSPIASAINTFRDVYENFDYALAKAKICQLFGLKIKTAADEGLGTTTGTTDPDTEEEVAPYEVDFGRGPFKLELDPGDDADILETKQPSNEFRAFTNTMIAVALKSLDIPFSFFDESFTNFYGSRGGLMQYLKSCDAKREDLAELLDAITAWRLALADLDGELDLPRGKTLDDVRWQWVPKGVPWWDPAKEVRGQAMAVAAGFTTFEHVVRETNGGTGDVYENININAKVLEHAKNAGFPIVLPGVNAFNPDPAAAGAANTEGGDGE